LPPRDERLQDHVAHVRALVQDLLQGNSRHHIHRAVRFRDGTDDGGAARQMRHVAGEFAAPVNRERARRIAGSIDDLHLAGLDYEKCEVGVPSVEERAAC
jgi:hypothetical protein